MQGPQSNLFRNFSEPLSPPFFTLRNGLDFLLNILTVGFYGTINQSMQKHRVSVLSADQQDLADQLNNLNSEWDNLQKDLNKLLEACNQKLSVNFKLIDPKRSEFSNRQLVNNTMNQSHIGVTQIALLTIAFVGQLLANVLSLGTYTLYRNHVLSYEITRLKNQNIFLKEEFNRIKSEDLKHLDQTLEMMKEGHKLQNQINQMAQTPHGKLFLDLQNLQANHQVLQDAQNKLQTQFQALQVEKVRLEQLHDQSKQDVSNMKRDLDAAKKKEEKAQRELKNVTAVLNKGKEIEKMAADLGSLPLKYTKRKEDQEEIPGAMDLAALDRSKLDKDWVAAAIEYNKLYCCEPEEKGTVRRCIYDPDDKFDQFLEKLKKDNNSLADKIRVVKTTPDKHKFLVLPASTKFKQLVEEKLENMIENECKLEIMEILDIKSSAAEIIEASFHHNFNWLMANKGDKIKLNKSSQTSNTDGRFALYRLMALRLIEFAKLTNNGCHGSKLQINPDVCMLPSMCERVLQLKDDQMGGSQLKVIVQPRQCDDFSYFGDAMGQNGVDPVGVKWILEQLTPIEKEYLFNLIMRPVIEESHPDLKKTQQYISNSNDHRVKLVLTAFSLIQDLGTSFSQKFGDSVLKNCWLKHATDDTILPFKKPDDFTVADIPQDNILISTAKSVSSVEWELDPDVIADERWSELDYSKKQRQPQFLNMVMASREQNQALFKNLSKVMAVRLPPGEEIKEVKFSNLNPQYYISHEMIGQFQATTKKPVLDKWGMQVFEHGVPQFDIDLGTWVGGQRCLFSNLLALFATKKSELTTQNVLYLRRAIAAYLDKLMMAKEEWKYLASKTTFSKEDQKVKEMAEFAEKVEAAILKNHRCSVLSYQLWLREEYKVYYKNQWVYPSNLQEMIDFYKLPKQGTYQHRDNQGQSHQVAQINISDLSPLEIQLAAYTMGVRIGLLGVKQASNDLGSPAKADSLGRILPKMETEFYGPNTEECLLMLCANQSYYAAKERINYPQKEKEMGVRIYNLVQLQENLEFDDWVKDNNLNRKDAHSLRALRDYWDSIKIN